jgi:4-amino-4-deoxy-L-arabinose transferase-like glycosyltransferase
MLVCMAVLQVVWLAAIEMTEVAAHPEKLPLLIVYSGVSFLVCWRMAATVGLSKRLACALQDERPVLTISGIGMVLILGLYTYLQNGWPDEQMVFSAAQKVVEQGIGPFFTNYGQIPWLGNQHPPLAVLIYGGALWLFGLHLFVIRLVAFVFSLGMLFLTYRIGCVLYDRMTGVWAAGVLFVTPFFFRIGTTALNDVPLTFCFVLAIFLTLRLVVTPSYRIALGMGLSIGAGLLCKYTMLLVYPVILIAVILSGQWLRLLPYLVVTMTVSLSIFSAWVMFAEQLGVLKGQRRTLGKHAMYVLFSGRGNRWLLNVLAMRLPSGIGMYLLPPLFLGVWHLFWQRSRSDLFVLLWILAVSLPLLLTLPGPRYFYPMFPALAIAIARGVLHIEGEKASLALFAFLSWAGVLYLFVDWYRAAGRLFLH